LSTATRQRKRSSIRAYELAHELGIEWRDLSALAAEVGIAIHNQLCGLDDEQAARLRQLFESKHPKPELPEVTQEVASKVEPDVEKVLDKVAKATATQEPVTEATESAQDGQAAAVTEPPTTAESEKELRPTGPAVRPAVEAGSPAEPLQKRVEPQKPTETAPSSPAPSALASTGGAVSTRQVAAGGPGTHPAAMDSPAAGTGVSPSASARPGSPPATSPTTTPTRPVTPTATPTASDEPTTSTPPVSGPKPVKHLVNLDQLRRRQVEKKQQTQPATPPSPSSSPAVPSAGPASPPATPAATAAGPTTTTPPPTSAGSTPTATVKASSTGGPVPILQRPRPKPATSPAAPETDSPKAQSPATRPFIIRRQVPPEGKKKERPPKKEQEQKPLATLDELKKQQLQAPPQQPAALPTTAGPAALKPPDKSKPDIATIRQNLGRVTRDEEEDEESRPFGKRRPGQVIGREERRQRRREEARLRSATTKAETLTEQDQEVEPARPIARRPRAEVKPAAPRPITQPRKGKVPIEPPITVRSLSEALGISAQELIRKLVQRGQMLHINATLTPELAEELALEYNLELEIKKPVDPEEEILKQLQAPDRPEDLVPRPPVVTVMGHVDHGKTSLLDRIRESDVASTEAGGITQHLRAWQVERGGKRITFLDTPGHEAFTAMRARGAHVTDIVVLVVAADDGVMPQTEEAISHARAANVPIIVAINKVDLPNANVQRTRNQLYHLGLIPDTMGGDTPFVETVAAKERPRGIQELLDMILLVAELRELKANPNKPGMGTCLEAKVTEGQGVVATLLVQNGTLRVGDTIVCGCTYGRVRAMFDSNGKPVHEAGPATPVAVTGLDDVPEADDKFFVVPDLATARDIAERRRERRQLAVPVHSRTLRLEDLDKTKLQELKIILKADVRGSIEAIKKELEKLQSDEIRLKVIHAGVGAITEGDVQLALASPQDTLIVGFNVVPDSRAQALAEQRQVQIRLYNIIYQLTDDLKAALEGRLKPREELVSLGRAVVREVFKISKVGTVAGCYVTQGVVERGAQVRVIREGRIIYPPPDRTATIESLRRFKDDVREVREGFECGIKISNFDDVKVDDVLEVFRIVQVQRTLDGTTSRS